MVNQHPEQQARDIIDSMLEQAGWAVQHNKKINFAAAAGIAVREYQSEVVKQICLQASRARDTWHWPPSH